MVEKLRGKGEGDIAEREGEESMSQLEEKTAGTIRSLWRSEREGGGGN